MKKKTIYIMFDGEECDCEATKAEIDKLLSVADKVKDSCAEHIFQHNGSCSDCPFVEKIAGQNFCYFTENVTETTPTDWDLTED